MTNNLLNSPPQVEFVQSERTVFLVTAEEEFWQRRPMQSSVRMNAVILAGVFSTLEQAQERANMLGDSAKNVQCIAVPVNAISSASLAETEISEENS